MFVRALIVLLVMLNLGVALWWATRAPLADAPPAASEVSGLARLQLASEVPRDDTPVQATVAPDPAGAGEPDASAPASPGETAAARCVALGPYADARVAAAARTALSGVSTRSRLREAAVAGRGWRVTLPPQSDRAAATAMAERLRAAGFDDLYVVAEGEDANAIALGRFGSEAAARSHAEALRAAGFDVRADAIGGEARHWIDIALAADATVESARRSAGAAQAQAIDCLRLD